MSRPSFPRIAIPLVTVALLASACGSEEPGSAGATNGSGGEALRVAAIFSGSTTDADYNALGLLALQEAQTKHGAETAHSESVPVPDAERVMKEYLADGYTVIWSHGSQYFEATNKLAKQYPDVTFIGEFDDKPKESVPNLWILDRNFHTAFYPIGILAAAQSKSGKIGYVGGLSLPFSYSEVHAINQAIKDSGSNATVTPVWTGDFNDPTKAQQITSQLIGQGNDVIIGSLNLGMVGAFQAVKGTDVNVVVTAKYTDKSQFDPEHYATSTIYDFTKPLDDMLAKIKAGETNGYYPLGFDAGVSIQEPKNVEPGVADKVNQAVADIKSGTITVEKNLNPIK